MALLRSNKNRWLLGVLLVISALGTLRVSAQTEPRKVRLGMVGYVSLPRNYETYRTNNVRDAWGGYIVAGDKKTIIVWYAGLVRTPFDNGDGKFVWIKRESLGKTALKYGLLHTNDHDVVAATLPGLSLVMTLRSDNDLDLFLRIARSFRREKCRGCERPLPEALSNKSLDASPDASGEREVIADFQLPIVDLICAGASNQPFSACRSLPR